MCFIKKLQSKKCEFGYSNFGVIFIRGKESTGTIGELKLLTPDLPVIALSSDSSSFNKLA